MTAKTLSKIEMKTLVVAVRDGFTFAGDSHFRDGRQGVRVIRRMIAAGLMYAERDGEAIIDYRPTQFGRDVIKYGSLEAALA